MIETPRQFSSGSPVGWVTGARAGSRSRSVTENTDCVWSPLSDLLCYLLREVVGGNVIARPVYLTVNIRQSEALLLSLGLAVQTGLGAAAQPDQTDQTTDYCYVTRQRSSLTGEHWGCWRVRDLVTVLLVHRTDTNISPVNSTPSPPSSFLTCTQWWDQ